MMIGHLLAKYIAPDSFKLHLRMKGHPMDASIATWELDKLGYNQGRIVVATFNGKAGVVRGYDYDQGILIEMQDRSCEYIPFAEIDRLQAG